MDSICCKMMFFKHDTEDEGTVLLNTCTLLPNLLTQITNHGAKEHCFSILTNVCRPKPRFAVNDISIFPSHVNTEHLKFFRNVSRVVGFIFFTSDSFTFRF